MKKKLPEIELRPSERIEQLYSKLYKMAQSQRGMGQAMAFFNNLEMRLKATIQYLDEVHEKNIKKRKSLAALLPFFFLAVLLSSFFVSPLLAQEYKECISEGQKITVLDPTSNREFFFLSKYYSDIKSLQKTTLNGEEGWLLEWELAGDGVKK